MEGKRKNPCEAAKQIPGNPNRVLALKTKTKKPVLPLQRKVIEDWKREATSYSFSHASVPSDRTLQHFPGTAL